MTDATRMKSLQIALIVFGGICIVGIYILMRIWPSGWAWTPAQSEYEQMILGFYATLGIFLILASRSPIRHLSLIWFSIWSSIVHGGIMLIQALIDESERGHFMGDIPALFIMAGVLWFLMPKNRSAMQTAQDK